VVSCGGDQRTAAFTGAFTRPVLAQMFTLSVVFIYPTEFRKKQEINKSIATDEKKLKKNSS
jgi:hypothetical protein